ncbi:MAG TPA: Gfo/Idh/MocA family oxidoreductase [Mycobacteriales bacterium]|nr:Gfo/Idh/MocA family oxidoreductase [Mycobacteriales bacterium]
MTDLRIGILGAARIAPVALVRPAQRVPGVAVTAVAARDPRRAATFAAKHGISRVLPSYADLLADPDIDAVYNPLPNGLHAEWTLAAIAAGKHVLCEKPFTSNAAEAEQVADAADASGLVVMEAFHYRYHALAERMRAIAHGGALGDIRSVRTWLCFPLPRFSDIRYDFALAGGASMDCCYPVHALRLLGPGEPEVVAATAKRLRGGPVDRAMTAHYRFPGGAAGRTDASMWSHRLVRISAHVEGSRGRMRVLNYVLPQLYNRLAVTVDGKTTRERVRGEPSYDAQLRAFAAAVREGAPFPTTARDAVTTMRLIDDIYRLAGLPQRGQPARR